MGVSIKGSRILPQGAVISKRRLTRICVEYIGFDGKKYTGRIICDRRLARELTEIFGKLHAAGYRIEKIKLAQLYGGDDDKIMSDNATSCFNYRTVANTNTLSLHALGRAVDINPLYNPYIQNGVIMPANGAKYADRSAKLPHMIDHEDICYKTFTSYGWKWGGDWRSDKDYQHFYKPIDFIERFMIKIKLAVRGRKV